MFKGSKMKVFVVILAIVMLSSFAIAGIIYFAQYGTNGFSFTNNVLIPANGIDVDEEKTASMSEIKSVKVDVVSEDINFIMTDSNEAKGHFYGRYSSNSKDNKPEFIMSTEAGVLTIEIKHKSGVNISYSNNTQLDIYLPRAYAGDLEIHAISAEIIIDEMNLESFNCTTTSGDIAARIINSKSAEFKTVSGAVNLKGKFDSLKFNSTSGDFTADEITSDSTTFYTISGRIKAAGVPGNVEARSTSGDIELKYESYNYDINVKTISGSTEIKLPMNSEFGLKFNSMSGGSKCDFPITITGPRDDHALEGSVGSSDNKITVASTSGDLDITK